MTADSPDRTRAVGAAVLIAVLVGLALLYYRGTAIDPEASGDPRADEIVPGEDGPSGTGSASPQPQPRTPPGPRAAAPLPPIRLSPAEASSDPSARHGALAGRVVSWSTSRPIAGAELTFASRGRTTSIRTGEDGAFLHHAAAVGEHTLSLVTADHFHPYAPEWDTSPLVFRAVAGQRVEGIVVYLVPVVSYAGLVLDAEGEPAADAQIRLIDRGGAERALIPQETDTWQSAEDGTFEFTAPDGALLESRHPELGRGRGRVDFGVQASKRLTIQLTTDPLPGQLSARIAGRVEADGTPLPDVAVFANPRPDNPADPAEQLHPHRHAISDAEGRFVIEGLDVGPHSLFARAPGYAAARDRAEAPADDVVLVMGSEALVEGTVKDATTGAPLASSTVVVERETGPLSRQRVATATTFGSDGRFVVRGLAAGSYEISATAHGYATSDPRPILVDADARTRVDLTLGRGATIRGVLTSGEGGPPIAQGRVTLEGTLGQDNSAVPMLVSATTDDEGAFTLTGVPPGSRSLFVAGEGHHGRVISGLVATEGAALELTIDLTPTEEGEEPRIELVGIGAVLSAVGDGLVIGRVVEGGGAAEAGLGSDDVILAVDGVAVTELGFGGAIERIRGREGSTLVLRVRRAGAEAEEDLVVIRKRIRA